MRAVQDLRAKAMTPKANFKIIKKEAQFYKIQARTNLSELIKQVLCLNHKNSLLEQKNTDKKEILQILKVIQQLFQGCLDQEAVRCRKEEL